MTPRREVAAGIRAELPILLGVLPFGLIYGALALQAGISPAPALAMSSIVFAGSAQFVATQLIRAGTPVGLLLLTTLVVNLRHLLYSASLAPHLRPLRPAWKAALAYLLTDEAYAVPITHYSQASPSRATPPSHGDEPDHRHWFFLGAGLTMWTTWQASTAAGLYLGARIPTSWHLEFALPLTFLALARPAVTDRATAITVLVASVVGIVSYGLAMRLGIIVAALAGIAAGIVAETRWGRR
ncbi:MAG TPA: AzlC family ABC transporter permease [bacterium]|nr:AzlC family ABC transporter permease [bacterium]